ncbi:MAG: amidohydrolase family protein [Thermodesulfobacteriota bacterium]|nr:amidohydrolase family protein [Thermodesulfobacteriota bacterium]
MIVDCSNTIPKFLLDDMRNPPDGFEGYSALFGPRAAQMVGWTEEGFYSRLHKDSVQKVGNDLADDLEKWLTMDTLSRQLHEAGITYHAIHNMDYGQDPNEAPVDHGYVADILVQYPKQFIGFAGFNPHKGTRSLKTVRRAIEDQGYKAAVISPYIHGVFADDRKYYPFYALCEEMNIPIWIHTSVNYLVNTSIYYGHPSHLEVPLIDFPDLKIIAGHGGWPWGNELVVMLMKYNNLYADTSATRPRYVASPNTGWDMFYRYMNNMIQDKVLFSSDWLSMGMPIQAILDEVGKWNLKDTVMEKFLWKNANRVFCLGLDKVS